MTDVDCAGRAQITSFDITEVPDMTFSSSPPQYPASSSPVPLQPPTKKQKRKLFQTLDVSQSPWKRPRLEDTVLPLEFNHGTSRQEPGPEKDIVNILPQRTDDTPPLVEIHTEQSNEAVPCPSIPLNLGRGLTRRTLELYTCSGKKLHIPPRKKQPNQTYEQVIADRSTTAEGRAKRAYYGIDIHQLVDEANLQRQLNENAKEVQALKDAEIQPTIEYPEPVGGRGAKRGMKYQMWTEKYRARKFTDLVGDERTHRAVLKWLKAWDTTVFPGSMKPKSKKIYHDNDQAQEQHRKILLLTGPPGLGKTTLAHVCAKQAGYEVLEINASDDRSRDVVKGRIKDALATETVRGIHEPGKTRKAGRPVCVVVDEVDGVVTGSSGSGGEGGFMKALIDLLQLDQRNSQPASQTGANSTKKGDKFKMLRPLILICNDVYAPSLRPLRQSSFAEIVHVRKPPLDKVIARLKIVFEKENIQCDNDAVRRICEDCWGMGNRKQSSQIARGAGDGDIRGVLVQGEWMAHKLRLDMDGGKLTRKWVESQITNSTTSTGQKGLGRGGVREVVERVFIEGAGLPNLPTTLNADEVRQVKEFNATSLGVADLRKRSAISALRDVIDTCGDHDRLMTDCFATYATRSFQDDTFLSKPNSSYDWLHFHDSLSSRIFSGQEWELNPYLSTSACAFHSLFAAVDRSSSSTWNNDGGRVDAEEEVHPFSGLKADFAAYEAEKQTKTILTEMQSSFSADLLRLFSSVDAIATELIPSVNHVLSPDVKPVVIGGSSGIASVVSVRKQSERDCVQSSVRVMNALNIAFEKVRIESEGYNGNTVSGGFALRMEPPIDTLSTYHHHFSASTQRPSTTQPTRYAIRQVLDQELRKEKALQASISRRARGNGTLISQPSMDKTSEKHADQDKENVNPDSSAPTTKPTRVKRDFFGRPLLTTSVDHTTDLSANTIIDASSIAKSTATKGKAKTRGMVEEGSDGSGGRIWMSFNEGFSNAVRKPITLADLMEGF